MMAVRWQYVSEDLRRFRDAKKPPEFLQPFQAKYFYGLNYSSDDIALKHWLNQKFKLQACLKIWLES